MRGPCMIKVSVAYIGGHSYRYCCYGLQMLLNNYINCNTKTSNDYLYEGQHASMQRCFESYCQACNQQSTYIYRRLANIVNDMECIDSARICMHDTVVIMII